MDALSPSGQHVYARYVGGCVRDALLGYAVKDIDIATEWTPKEVLKRVESRFIRAVPTGMEHGTITLVCGRFSFEVTSLRKDVITDGRHAIICHTRDWEQDALRRDFTINAVYVDRYGELYDPVGGVDHMQTGKVCFIGDAHTRIREDYLRILRFFRFYALYGRGEIDQKGLSACVRLQAGIEKISAERIWQEIKKMLLAKNPCHALMAMKKTGVLTRILPGVHTLTPFSILVDFDLKNKRKPDGLLRLYALIFRSEYCIEFYAQKLKMSRHEYRTLLEFSFVFSRLSEENSTGRQAAYWIYKGKKREALAIAGLKMALSECPKEKRFYHAFSIQIQQQKKPVFPVSASLLMAQGMKADKSLGEALKALEDIWIETGFKASKEKLLACYKKQGGLNR